MTTTTNLGLKKPADTDAADIADINYNTEILDAKIGAVGNTSLQDQLGTSAMGTTATTVTGAIAEHEGDISGLTSSVASNTQTINALDSNLSKHYVQIASQSGSDLWESVKATLNLYPHFASLSSGDSVTIAGGYLGNYTYAINFTKTQPNFQVGTVQENTHIHPFTFDNSTNTLNH